MSTNLTEYITMSTLAKPDASAPDNLKKEWIDQASYEDLFRINRFDSLGSPWVSGEIGGYLLARLNELRNNLTPQEHTRISKLIGW